MGKNNDDNCILMFIFVLRGAKISKNVCLKLEAVTIIINIVAYLKPK